ncbi:hypothetical protein [Marinobacterium sp. BA1]|uniref:hypothetical protein n=1 Tax=Marinobacterium sp. BA1 TaxID=3138931 RepID=UPI0032E5D81C
MRTIATPFLVAVFLVISGCASLMDRASQPDRTYGNIEYENLYRNFEKVLTDLGYGVDKRNYSRGYISSTLREYDGEKKGLATWLEKRKYVAWFDIDRSNPKRHFLILKVDVKEKAPLSFEWRDKEIERASDAEYQKILSALDEIVVENGGTLQ